MDSGYYWVDKVDNKGNLVGLIEVAYLDSDGELSFTGCDYSFEYKPTSYKLIAKIPPPMTTTIPPDK